MKNARQRELFELLQRMGELSTVQACSSLHASAATIRRDFGELAASGLARRTHGGIGRIECAPNSMPIGLRGELNIAEKHRIAKCAAGWIGPDRSMFIYGGSTTGLLGRYLNSGKIVTNFSALCKLLSDRFPTGNGPRVILTGGELDYPTGNLYGNTAAAMVARYSCELSIASAYGLDENGLSDLNDDCAAMIQAMMRNAGKKIVLADSSKFRRRGFCRVTGWNGIDYLFTSRSAENAGLLKRIREAGVEIIYADSSTR